RDGSGEHRAHARGEWPIVKGARIVSGKQLSSRMQPSNLNKGANGYHVQLQRRRSQRPAPQWWPDANREPIHTHPETKRGHSASAARDEEDGVERRYAD